MDEKEIKMPYDFSERETGVDDTEEEELEDESI
jgi:hypothetical protein